MSSDNKWSGSIVVRFLEKDIDPQYEQTKPKSRVDISTLRLSSAASTPGYSGPRYCPRNHDSKQASSSAVADPLSSVNLDVCLTVPTLNSAINASLSRKGGEDAENCLNRLSLSIAKKVNATVARGKKKGKGKEQLEALCAVTSDIDGAPIHTAGLSNSEFWAKTQLCPTTITFTKGDMTIPLQVTCNPPTVLGISTFEKFGAEIFPGVPVYVSVDLLFATRAIVDWYADGEKVCQDSHLYIPTENDANKALVVVVTPIRSDHNGEGCAEAYQFLKKVASQRPENTVLGIRQDWQLPRSQSASEIRVMSFNILADQNAFAGPDRQPFFAYVSADLLQRGRRLPLILHEILAYNADVICLQEVDQLIYETLFQPVLQAYNYQGFYSVKQSSGNQEGCALFWSLKKFQRVADDECKTFALGKLLARYEAPLQRDLDWKPHANVITDLFTKRPDLLDIVKKKLGHIVQMVHLRDSEGNPLIVANTHLFFHPFAPHIRVLQLFAIAHQITIEQGAEQIPFIFCGDLNTSLQHCAALWMNRHVPKNHRDYRMCLNTFSWGQERSRPSEKKFDDDFPEMTLPLSFPEVGTAYPDCPDFTHYVAGFKGTLDHILMTPTAQSGELRFRRQAEMPTLAQVTRDTAMPSPSFPSDHVAVVADLEWFPKKANDLHRNGEETRSEL